MAIRALVQWKCQYGILTQVRFFRGVESHYQVLLMMFLASLDLLFGVQCTHNQTVNKTVTFNEIPKDHMRPIYYMNGEFRAARHQQWVDIVREEEASYEKKEMKVSAR
jgi:hypothetical protein